MGRLIVILASAVAIFYFFGGGQNLAPSSGGPTTPPSRLPVPKKTAQIEARPAVISQQKPGVMTFQYKLELPGLQQPQSISFELPEEALASAGKEMPLYNSGDIQKVLTQDAPRMEREITQEETAREQQVVNIINRDVLMKNGVTMVVDVDRRGDKNVRFQYWQTHQNKETLGYLKETVKTMMKAYYPYQRLFERQNFVARQTQYLSQYLPYNYYAYDLKFNFETQKYSAFLRPDFARFAGDQREILYPLAQEIFKATPVKDPRNLAAMALYFIQAIPVDPRDRERDLLFRTEPFTTPAYMLVKNQGSADTKATALASLLGILLPDYTVVMYLLPEHAAIGVNLQPQANDFIHKDPSGNQFVVMEPYGPGLTPIGQVTDYTRLGLGEGGMFNYFIVP